MMRILEQFEGFVEKIVGNTAFVMLQSELGDKLYGEIEVEELVAKNIKERRRFKCQVVEEDEKVTIVLEAIPDKEISEEEEKAIGQEIDRLLGNDG